MSFYHRLLRSYWWVRDSIRWRNFDADLGETLSRSEERYGSVVHISDLSSRFPEHEFKLDGIDVTIAYIESRAAMVWHSSDRAFSNEFKDACFDAYSNGLEWIPIPHAPPSIRFGGYRNPRFWERADRKAWASIYQTGENLDSLKFSMDFTCGRWQRLKNVVYGVWTLKNK